MSAGPWLFTTAAKTKLLDGTFAIGTDSFKQALLASTSNIGAGTTTFAGVTNELSTANGYTAGGQAVTVALTGTTTITVSNLTWTASGGSITARWSVIYEVGGDVLCYRLLDSTPADVTATDGNTLNTIDTAGLAVVTFA